MSMFVQSVVGDTSHGFQVVSSHRNTTSSSQGVNRMCTSSYLVRAKRFLDGLEIVVRAAGSSDGSTWNRCI